MRNVYRLDGSLIFLTVGDGVEACVDAEDLPKVSPYKWRAYGRESSKRTDTQYVQATIGRKTVYLHRLIADAPSGATVDHLNHDPLDNRRANLRVVSNQANCMNRDGAYRSSKTGVRGVSAHKNNNGDLSYVFRCHGETCRDVAYFPHTEHGLRQAEAYSEAHHAGVEPPAWTRERPPIKHPNHKPLKLSDDDVRAIRKAYAARETQSAIAERFGIAGSLVSLIGRRLRRANVPDEA